MFDYPENQREFYYQTYEGSEPEYDEDGYLTGENLEKYSEPVLARAMISENLSDAVEMPFGKDLVYDKLMSTVQDLPIDEYSRLYVDVVPEIDEDGKIKTPHDYEVKRVAKGLYQKVWAIQKVSGYVAKSN